MTEVSGVDNWQLVAESVRECGGQFKEGEFTLIVGKGGAGGEASAHTAGNGGGSSNVWVFEGRDSSLVLVGLWSV